MHIASSLKVLCCQCFCYLYYNAFIPIPPHAVFPLAILHFLTILTSPFTLDFSGSVQFGCNHPTQCGDLPGANVPVDTVIANLAADDTIADCHRFCSVVLEEADTSQCLFTFPDGNRLSLVVLDDEGKILSLSSDSCTL